MASSGATSSSKKIVGRAEKVSFPELQLEAIPARIDTGAKTSSIWASEITEKDGVLQVVLFAKGSSLFTGQSLQFDSFDIAVISTSTGEVQRRYKVRLLVKLQGKKVRAWFTLADRSTQVYPVLIGRNVLLGKFVVDVKKGRISKDAEAERTRELRGQLSTADEEE